jgi:type VI secretion system ImpM family protein
MTLAYTIAMGWTGKLPWVGDYVGRGLPWQRSWDDWLQRSLVAAEPTLGPALLRERIRGMAPWQCLLLPRSQSQLAWCGLVAGSSDRVGRAYPLLLGEGLASAVLDTLSLAQLQARALALSDWLWDAAAFESLEEFEQAAAAWAASDWPAAPRGLGPNGAAAADDTVADLRSTWPAAASFWWCTEPVADTHAPLAEAWPPREALLLTLLGA